MEQEGDREHERVPLESLLKVQLNMHILYSDETVIFESAVFRLVIV